MISKTPKFDSKLDEYFADLKLDKKGGQWRNCRFSGEKFYVRPEDVEFYKRIRVPLPTLSPHERRRRRVSSLNGYTFFKKESDYSGKKIISMYPPQSPYKVFEHKVWYSDQWEPVEYATDYNPGEPIFKQIHELMLKVPHPNLFSDISNINSDFTNVSKNLKNCYFTFDQNKGEELYYHQCCEDDKNCIECWGLDFCDTCYECKFGEKLFKCFWCEECRNCIESYFLWDCRGCRHCFMSSGLRNKEYYFRNEYVGKEEWEKRMKEIYFGSWKNLKELKKEYEDLKIKAPRRPNWNEKSVNIFGDYIQNSRNVYFAMFIAESENVSYSEGVDTSRDSYDLFGVSDSELCYELANIWYGENYNSKFSMQIDGCRDVELSELCSNSKNCFGCVALKNKQFCIFNKQYSEVEYWKLVDEIKTKMLKDGEYGEFFPPQYLQLPYRATYVGYYYGFWDFENAKKYGYDTSIIEDYGGSEAVGETIKSDDLPDDIKNTDDEILQEIILDTKNDKKFRFIKQELDFYRKYGIPLPRENPASRMTAWRKKFGIIFNFYKRECPKCGKEFETSYAPGKAEVVYCERCYQNYLN